MSFILKDHPATVDKNMHPGGESQGHELVHYISEILGLCSLLICRLAVLSY